MAALVQPRPGTSVPYVAGVVTAPAGVVANLLWLIQQQLEPDCPGTAVEFQLGPDLSNSGGVYVGAYSRLGGPLTSTNYAYQLLPASPARLYRSSYPGTSAPIGQLQVLAVNVAILHVEVQT